MRRPAPHIAAGVLLIVAGVALALLVDRGAGIVTVLVGVGFLLPLRPGRRPDEEAARRPAVEQGGDHAPPPDPDRNGGAGRRP